MLRLCRSVLSIAGRRIWLLASSGEAGAPALGIKVEEGSPAAAIVSSHCHPCTGQGQSLLRCRRPDARTASHKAPPKPQRRHHPSCAVSAAFFWQVGWVIFSEVKHYTDRAIWAAAYDQHLVPDGEGPYGWKEGGYVT